MKSETNKVLKVVSLFTGGGGLDLGLEAAGFTTVFATDIDEHSCLTLQNNKAKCKERNVPILSEATIVRKDIKELDASYIFEKTKLKKGQLDLMAGGPPCQSFSVFGNRKGKDDPRGMLAYEYLRMLVDLEPKAFVFENVYGLLTIDEGKVFSELCEALSNPNDGLSYKLSIFRLNAADYGVPQFRDRVFIIGSKNGKVINEIPKICSNNEVDFLSDETYFPYRTVLDGLRGLPPMGVNLSNHTGRNHSERIKQRYSSLAYGERDPKTRINRLNPVRPSFTIIVGSDQGGGKGHVHPFEAREVTPRESARMQTFPDWWEFSGTSRHPIRQVGNAVPPLLSALIGREIMSSIFKGKRKSLNEIVTTLSLEYLFTEDIDDI